MATTLIIGATGNIGYETARHFLAKSPARDLRLISSRADGCTHLRAQFPNVEVIEADLYQQDSLLPALEGIERIFMNVPDMLDERRATPNLLTALDATNSAPHILRFCAYPPHKTFEELTPITQASGIGAAKHYIACEALLASGRPLTMLNAPCWFMSNLTWMSAEAVRNEGCLNIPHPHTTPWIAPADIGEASANLLLEKTENLRKEYIITGPELFDFPSVAALMSATFASEIRYDSSPQIFRRYFGDMTDAMVEYFEHSKIDYGVIEPTDVLPKLLGHAPITLKAWLDANRAAFGY